MKKTAWVLLFSLVFMLLVSGCGKKPPETVAEDPQPQVEEPVTNVFYQQMMESESRPIGIMIDNDNEGAWPHAGLEDAYMVYEILVEGGATRFLAMFRDAETEKIGPVRSSRHYFLDYVLENDAMYVHYGWSPQAQQDLTTLGIDKINGILGGDGNVFWRERKHANDWHSAYTSIENIKSYAKDTKGFGMTSDKHLYEMHKEDVALSTDATALAVSIPYAGFYKVGYTFNAETNSYDRYVNGAKHVTQAGAELSVKNLILQKVQVASLGDGSDRVNVTTTGSGEGVYLTGGKQIPITWSKASRSDKTIYRDSEGNEIVLNPGQTWIHLVPSWIQWTIS